MKRRALLKSLALAVLYGGTSGERVVERVGGHRRGSFDENGGASL